MVTRCLTISRMIIVEGLFEHYYVRPVIETEKLEKVNEKLRQLGRDPL